MIVEPLYLLKQWKGMLEESLVEDNVQITQKRLPSK